MNHKNDLPVLYANQFISLIIVDLNCLIVMERLQILLCESSIRWCTIHPLWAGNHGVPQYQLKNMKYLVPGFHHAGVQFSLWYTNFSKHFQHHLPLLIRIWGAAVNNMLEKGTDI
jgi:hypothetical protein